MMAQMQKAIRFLGCPDMCKLFDPGVLHVQLAINLFSRFLISMLKRPISRDSRAKLARDCEGATLSLWRGRHGLRNGMKRQVRKRIRFTDGVGLERQ